MDAGFRSGSRGASGLFSQLTSLKGLLVATGAAAAVAFAVQTVKGFLAAASSAEQLRSRLEILFQSQEKGNAAFERFKVLATELPFSLNQVANAGTTLASVAGGSVRGLESLLRATANLAAATGLSLEEAAAQVVRVQSAGFAAADLLRERGVRQFVEAQLQITDITELSLEKQREAFLKVYGADGVLGGAASNLFNTIEGQFSLVGDAVENFQRDVGEAIVATGVVQEVTAALVEILSDPEFKNQVTESMVQLAEVVKEDVLPSLRELPELLNFTIRLVRVMVEAFKIAAKATEISRNPVSFFLNKEEQDSLLDSFERIGDLLTDQKVTNALKDQTSAQQTFNDELDTTASRIQRVTKETENAAQRITELIAEIRSATDPIFAAQSQFAERTQLLQQAAPGLTQQQIQEFSTVLAQDFVKQLTEAEKQVQEEKLRLERDTAEETRRVIQEVFAELPETLQRTVTQLRFLERVPAAAAQNAQFNLGREPQNVFLDREFLQETERVLLEGIKSITERLQLAQTTLFDLEGQGIFAGTPLDPNMAALLQERREQLRAEVEALQKMLEEATGGLAATRDALQLVQPTFGQAVSETFSEQNVGETLNTLDQEVNATITSSIGEGFRNALRGGGFDSFLDTLGNRLFDVVVDALVESFIAPVVQAALKQFFSIQSASAGAGGGTTGGGAGGTVGTIVSILGLFARTGGTITPQGRLVRMQGGGLVPDISGRPFADSVPALLTPGERVLTREENKKFEQGLGGMNVSVNITTQSLDPSNAADVILKNVDAIEGALIQRFETNSQFRRSLTGR